VKTLTVAVSVRQAQSVPGSTFAGHTPCLTACVRALLTVVRAFYKRQQWFNTRLLRSTLYFISYLYTVNLVGTTCL